MNLETFEIQKPTLINKLFTKYDNDSPPFYLTMAVESIKAKFPLAKERERLIYLMSELPLSAKERTSIKRKITRRINVQQKMVDDYEKKYGEIIVKPTPTTYSHFEEGWLKTKA